MKVLTVRQPWAGLMVGSFQKSHNILRKAEVRKWMTSYRGELLIHAGTALDKEACERFGIVISDTDRGIVVGRANLTDVVRIKNEREWSKLRHIHLESGKRCYGDETFLWLLSNPVLFTNPIPCLGKLRLWIPPQEILERLAKC